jgi:hypothetical protein
MWLARPQAGLPRLEHRGGGSLAGGRMTRVFTRVGSETVSASAGSVDYHLDRSRSLCRWLVTGRPA